MSPLGRLVAAACAAAMTVSMAAHGQTREHQALPQPHGLVHPLALVTLSAPVLPIAGGPPLRHIVIEGPPTLVDGSLGAALESDFAGKSISPALIDGLEKGVAARLGASGRPVAVGWRPEGAIADGVVTLVVDDDTAALLARLGVTRGKPVDPARLAYDLKGLNRYPYRQASAAVTPTGDGADVSLTVIRKRPWEFYSGFKYLGSRQKTLRRYYAGGTIGNMLGQDSLLSFQMTGTPDIVLHGDRHPVLKDFTLNYSRPLGLHSQAEAAMELDEINFPLAPYIYRISDVIGSAGMRLDLRDRDATVSADIRMGIEARNEKLITLNSGLFVGQQSSEDYQLYFGYHRSAGGDERGGDFDILAHLSPGGLDPGNSDAQYRRYNDGRVTSARYAYVYVNWNLRRRLSSNLMWHGDLIGQLSTSPLPFIEQALIGGPDLVHGYRFIDGSFDDMLIVRNRLGLCGKGGCSGPYAFFDLGTGRDKGLRKTDLVGSAGFGADLHLTKSASLSVFAVHTLGQGQFTDSGINELGADIEFRY